MRPRAIRLWVSSLLVASWLGSCSPSAFDDLTSRDEAESPSIDCETDEAGCGPQARDAGAADGGTRRPAEAPPDDSAPPQPTGDSGASPPTKPVADAAPPRRPAEPDAGPAPLDAGEMRPSTEEWPMPTEEPLPARLGCVYPQWCGKTAYSAGAVCRLFPGCQIDVNTRKECSERLAARCGVPVKPIFLCDRASMDCVTP